MHFAGGLRLDEGAPVLAPAVFISHFQGGYPLAGPREGGGRSQILSSAPLPVLLGLGSLPQLGQARASLIPLLDFQDQDSGSWHDP